MSALGVALVLAACGASGAAGGRGGGRVRVAAAENVWGSLASQLGGAHADVVSILTNPDADPHAYEPTPRDGRTFAAADYVIVNGAGYDAWASKLVEASSSGAQEVLAVAALAGRREGDNPHMWYSPAVVARVVDRIASDLERLDPADTGYFAARRAALTSTGFAGYDRVRASIRSGFRGARVGATESLFADLARDLGLDLVTPPDYMRAISEGSDPTAADKSTVDTQIADRELLVLVINPQNSTPDVQALADRARAARIPVVAMTETLVPSGATFQDWQVAQLDALETALLRATGR